jgi:threonyl-tRNA synthetase
MNQPVIQHNNSINITLPDGSVRTFASAVTGEDIAANIGVGLAKAAIAMKVDGSMRDLSELISSDASVTFLTTKDAEGLDIMRHTLTAQVLALAIKELYPTAKLAIGPTIDYGFYYDIELEEKQLSTTDLPIIEAKMREILGRKNQVKREMWEREKAVALFESLGETYKAEIIKAAAEHDTTETGKISLYRQGEGESAFVDLCRGPHAPSLAHISDAFSLTKIAGAYWRGDSNNEMLQRIYGIAFADKKALQAHLTMLEEAEKRDHRKLGRELDLFHFEDSAPGQPFWHHNGWTIYSLLISYMRKKIARHGYTEVNSPQMLDVNFWKYSGHWDKYRENMFVIDTESDAPFALKPMSCPGNVQIFKQGLKSYRDLPLKMAEFGKVFRHESHGARHGLMRVQGFTQDDAHIFCTNAQLEDEVVAMCDLIKDVYTQLGFNDVRVKFSTRPEQRIGSEEDWDKAEAILRKVCDRIGFEWELNAGDGAFYAPKLDFVLRDAIGRDWQCGTIQVDMNLPTRLDISYIGEDGQKHRPHMVHRAIMGSIERFMGILIEHYAGKFPFWLCPTQVAVVSINPAQADYANMVASRLREGGLRVICDTQDELINNKIKQYSTDKIPVILAVGGREAEANTVAVRRLGSTAQEVLPFEQIAHTLIKEGAIPD